MYEYNGEKNGCELFQIFLFLNCYITVSERSTTSRQSDYDVDGSDHVLDSSKLSSDNSDNSDVEEQTTGVKRAAKTCVQRLFSPDSRNELYLDRLASPENSYARNIPQSGRESSAYSKTLSEEVHHSDSETDSGHSKSNDAKNVSNDNMKEKLVSDKRTDSVVKGANAINPPARKIWSIANIIG